MKTRTVTAQRMKLVKNLFWTTTLLLAGFFVVTQNDSADASKLIRFFSLLIATFMWIRCTTWSKKLMRWIEFKK